MSAPLLKRLNIFRSDDERIADKIQNREKGVDTVDTGSVVVSRYSKIILTFLIGILVVIIIWAVFAWYYNDFIGRALLKFPTPWQSFERLYEFLFESRNLFGHTIYDHILASMQRWMVAFVLAAGTGIFLGIVIGASNFLYPIGMVPVSVFQMIPGLAWLPIALLLFGLGDDAAIFIIYVVSAMVITINVAAGMRRMPQSIKKASDMMGANRTIYFFKIMIPYSTVDIVNGLRLGMSSAWRVLIAAEMIVGTGIGLGYAISMTRTTLDYVSSFTCIMIICIIGLMIDKIIFAKIEKYARQKMGMEEGI